MGRTVRDTIHAVARLSPRHALSAPEAALFVGISEILFREFMCLAISCSTVPFGGVMPSQYG
jgi:hypothetical protein